MRFPRTQVPERCSDVQLVERVRDRRDDRALAALYDRHSTLAMSTALRIVREHGLACDAVQAAFLDVWRASESYVQDRGAVSAWIAAIAKNRAIDLQRRARTQMRVERAVGSACHTLPQPVPPPELLCEADRSDRWRAGVDELPKSQREVILMAYYRGLSHTEIASRLDLPLGTVKSRVRLGLARLRHHVAVDPSAFD